MIEWADITSFGSYSNFSWKESVRDPGKNIAKFKKLNILYGRNYSGKTTLSRVIRCLETGALPKSIKNPDFVLSLAGKLLKSSEVDSSGLTVRVYNKDFVDENLSFLRDADGKIIPFAILGESNAEIKAEIDKLEAELGSIHLQQGFRFQYHLKKSEFSEHNKKLKTKRAELDQLFTDKANKAPHGIKHNVLFKDPNYDAKKLKGDIQRVGDDVAFLLSEEEMAKAVTTLKESPLPKIPVHKFLRANLPSLQEEVRKLLGAKIAPTAPIQELLNDAVLQAWAKSGIELHRGIRDNCALCGSPIPPDLWQRLDNHFNEESKSLQRAIAVLKRKILDEQAAILSFLQANRRR